MRKEPEFLNEVSDLSHLSLEKVKITNVETEALKKAYAEKRKEFQREKSRSRGMKPKQTTGTPKPAANQSEGKAPKAEGKPKSEGKETKPQEGKAAPKADGKPKSEGKAPPTKAANAKSAPSKPNPKK